MPSTKGSFQQRNLRFFAGAAKYESLEDGKRPRRLVWGALLTHANRPIPMAMLFGTICCMAVIGYMAWLSRQNLRCLSWSVDCHVHRFAEWNLNNLAIAQGLTTVLYAIGLVAMAYAVQTISETALWPLHSKRPLSLEQIDTYLLIVRGALPTHTAFIGLLKSMHSGLFLVASILITLTPLAAAPLLGTVWARIDAPHEMHSWYQRGGGIGRIYVQTNPPVSVGAESLSAYISWSRNLSSEPLPEYRDWIIDRSVLVDRGNMTVQAVRLQNTITCNPWNVTEIVSPAPDVASFSTGMALRNNNFRLLNSSDHVHVRVAETLAVWADDYTFVHTNRSAVKLILAAFNGTIENGMEAKLSRNASLYPTTLSTIACDIDVEFVDDILVIGRGGPPNVPPTKLTAISDIHISFKNSSTNDSMNTLNENALWSAAAPLIVCPTVDGAQPMYYKDKSLILPTGYTKAPFQTYESGTRNNDWTLDEISHFIRVAIGSTALASASNFQSDHPEPAYLTSLVYNRRLAPGRVIYLAVPVIVVLVGEAMLLYWNVILHRQEGIPVMRMAGISDILENVTPVSRKTIMRSGGPTSSGHVRTSSKEPLVKSEEIMLGDVKSDSDITEEPVRNVEAMLGRGFYHEDHEDHESDHERDLESHSLPEIGRLELGDLEGVGRVALNSNLRKPPEYVDARISRYRSLHPQPSRYSTAQRESRMYDDDI